MTPFATVIKDGASWFVMVDGSATGYSDTEPLARIYCERLNAAVAPIEAERDAYKETLNRLLSHGGLQAWEKGEIERSLARFK